MDREQRIKAGFDIARALGLPEGRAIVAAFGYEDGTTITAESDLGKQLLACWAQLGVPMWTRHLPTEARTEMTTELAGLSGEQLETCLAAWRSTAEVYADPELLARLSAPSNGDGGRVPMPEAADE